MKNPQLSRCILKTRFLIIKRMRYIKVKYKKVIGVCTEQGYLMISQKVAGDCINKKAERERVDRLRDKMFHLASLKLEALRGVQE